MKIIVDQFNKIITRLESIPHKQKDKVKINFSSSFSQLNLSKINHVKSSNGPKYEDKTSLTRTRFTKRLR